VSIATSHGAHLDLLTMLCMTNRYELWTLPTLTDLARRQAIFDRLLEETANSDRGAVSLVDYGSMLCPQNRFTEFLDGVQVRAADDVHTPAYVPNNVYAGNSSATVAGRFYSWLAGRLWPRLLATSGLVAVDDTTGTAGP
jgi:hypothetical protein